MSKKMKAFGACAGLAAAGLIWLAGCGKGGDPASGPSSSNSAVSNSTASNSVAPPAAAAKFLLATEPAGAKNVADVREQAKDKDEVVLVGRIGGDRDPWVEGTAAFKITDLKCVPCSERPGDDCKWPWDYCCEPAEVLKKSVALVQIVDDQGKVIQQDAKKSLGFKELQTLVIQGVAERDQDNNLTVNAKKVFIRK